MWGRGLASLMSQSTKLMAVQHPVISVRTCRQVGFAWGPWDGYGGPVWTSACWLVTFHAQPEQNRGLLRGMEPSAGHARDTTRLSCAVQRHSLTG